MAKHLNVIFLLIMLWCISTSFVWANLLNTEVNKMVNQLSSTQAGQQLFEVACASCHNKDLSGATGFNLKDGEWVHGSKPTDIVKNIQNGFPKAGMPGFGGIYNDQQVKEITAYVLSKREGWDNLEYELYQLDANAELSFNELEGKHPIKTGTLSKNLADYQIPEISNYALIFKGDFYTPSDKNVKLSSNNPGYVLLDASVNGEPAQAIKKKSFPLKKVKQQLVVRMMILNNRVFAKHKKSPRTNVSLMVTGKDSRKLFPASTRAVSAMTANKLVITAKKIPVVQRKKVLDLPPFSIVVGLPEKINYAFNPKDCSISGAWTGELLNIGPNVKNRGSDHSLILGKWLFHSPNGIVPTVIESCRFDEYTRLGDPKFYFTIDTVKYSVEAKVIGNQRFELSYQVLANPNKVKTFVLTLPKNVNISSKGGERISSQLKFNLLEKRRFSITVNG